MQGLLEMSTNVGQKRSPGPACTTVSVACRGYSWEEREVGTHHSCFTGTLALLQPAGHVVKVSLHRAVSSL